MADSSIASSSSAWIANPELHGETIELRFGKGVSAVLLDWILSRDHKKRIRENVADVVDCHLPLRHGFEQGALSSRRGAVDLVG